MKSKWVSLLLLCVGAVAVPSCAKAETPELLQTALDALVAEDDHWAYTMTTRDLKGKEGTTIEVFDPSQPPETQWSLVQWKGKPPSEDFVRSWRKKKIKEQEKEESEDSMGDLMDIDKAYLKSSEGGISFFEVPLRKGNQSKLSAKACRLLFTVDERKKAVTRIELVSVQDFRVAAVARIKAFGLRIAFTEVDPAHLPAVSRVEVEVKGRAFGLFRFHQQQEILLTEHRRVKPYKDRFAVKIGDVKALNF